MDPRAWRKKQAGLSLRAVATRLGCASPQTVRRYETGEREVPNSIALAYATESGGAVTAKDLDRTRNRYLKSRSTEAA